MTDIDLARLVEDEDNTRIPGLTLGRATQLGLFAYDLAEARGLPISMVVVHQGREAFAAPLAGSAPIHDDWARRKARVVTHFHKSSMRVRIECEEKGSDLLGIHGFSPLEWQAAGGAVPLFDEGGAFQGVLSVSGLVQVADHQFCMDVIREFQAEGTTS